MNRSILAIAVASLLPHASLSYAQEASSDETMVVTANRFEQSVDSVLAPVSVVTREDIEQLQAKSLPEVLRTLTGIEVAQNGGRGQLASIFVRGSNSTHVLVLIDGVRMAKAATGGVDFNQVPLTQVERIEYVRGARAAMYGSEAIAGVINIITLGDKNSEPVTKLSGGIGSRNYQELSAAATLDVSDNGKLKLAAGYEKDDGYNVKPVAGVNDGDEHGFKGQNALIGYSHEFSSHWTAAASLRYYKNIYQYDGSYYSSFSKSWVYSEQETEVENTALNTSVTYTREQFSSTLQFAQESGRTKRYDAKVGSTDKDSITDLGQSNISWVNRVELSEKVTLSGGLDWRNESWDDVSSTKQDKKERSNAGVYALVQGSYDRLTLEGSLRRDDNQAYGGNSTYNLGAGWRFTESLQLVSSVGSAFKAPNLYQNYHYQYGNKNLSPESSKNIDVSLRGQQTMFDWAITGYQMEIDDLIAWASNGYFNVDGVSKIKGIELETSFDTGFVKHTLSADFKDAKDATGNKLVRRADETFKWNAMASVGDFDLAATYLYVGDRPENTTTTLDAYDLLDLAATYWVNSEFSLKARLANAFNEEYETAKGYPAPERAWYLSASYQF